MTDQYSQTENCVTAWHGLTIDTIGAIYEAIGRESPLYSTRLDVIRPAVMQATPVAVANASERLAQTFLVPRAYAVHSAGYKEM